jgi:hypothetical protein
VTCAFIPNDHRLDRRRLSARLGPGGGVYGAESRRIELTRSPDGSRPRNRLRAGARGARYHNHMSDVSLVDALLNARKLRVDLQRHIDHAAELGDIAEVGRAWVRATQLERVLRSVLPPDATEIAEAAEEAEPSDQAP